MYEGKQPPPHVTAQVGHDTARLWKGMADHLASIRDAAGAQRAMQESQWWMAYAIATGQISTGDAQRERDERWIALTAEDDIERCAWRDIDLRKPLNSIMADAHNINGAAGVPLAEEAVTNIVFGVIERAYWKARRHGKPT